jgi:hypothetical protein
MQQQRELPHAGNRTQQKSLNASKTAEQSLALADQPLRRPLRGHHFAAWRGVSEKTQGKVAGFAAV